MQEQTEHGNRPVMLIDSSLYEFAKGKYGTLYNVVCSEAIYFDSDLPKSKPKKIPFWQQLNKRKYK